MTHEHLFADWLKQYIPRELTEHRARTAFVGLHRDEISTKRHTGDPHSQRLRCVCRECNNGWMSELQQAAKPCLVPMLEGKPIALHRRAQTVLAAWIAMTVMVAEHRNLELVAVPQSDRTYLLENLRPPSHWRIWIGRHKRIDAAMFTHNVLSFANPGEKIQISARPTDREPNTQTTTICLGKYLIIHVMSSVPAWNIVRRWKLPAPRDGASAVLQIWPIRPGPVKWPPAVSLTDIAIDLLANEFIDKATDLVRQTAQS